MKHERRRSTLRPMTEPLRRRTIGAALVAALACQMFSGAAAAAPDSAAAQGDAAAPAAAAVDDGLFYRSAEPAAEGSIPAAQGDAAAPAAAPAVDDGLFYRSAEPAAEGSIPAAQGDAAAPAAAPAVDDGLFYYSAEPVAQEPSGEEGLGALGAVDTAAGVTEEMCAASYWDSKAAGSGIGPRETLISREEIGQLGAELLRTEGANMNDLPNLPKTYDADARRKNLAASTVAPGRAIYVDGVLLEDRAAYYGELARLIEETGYTGSSRGTEYAVAVARTVVSALPTKSYIGYSATDSDDEKVSSAINVNEPFVIGQRAEMADGVFYWGYTDHCTGWVAAEDLAICRDEAEWLDMWRVDPEKSDFIVVTQNQITLEPSYYHPETAEVKLTFATILKEVPRESCPSAIGERGSWNNRVVYLPTRGTDGRLEKRVALISQHYEVSEGFLEMTQAEVLRVAFCHLGDRYGWGGMLDSMDCSLYTRNIYRCFGLNLPRNTTWQQTVPGRKIDLSAMTDEEKLAALDKMPAGTLLYFPGHTMVYVGMEEMVTEEYTGRMAYVISDTGSLSDTTGELSVRSMYSIILNPLTTRRRAGTTWLNNLTAAVLPIAADKYAAVQAAIEGTAPKPDRDPIRVPVAEGQTYASSKDTLPLETFLGTTKNLYLSFANVASSGAQTLSATVVKGSRVTTKLPVLDVRCDRKVASCKIGSANRLATVTLKSSGTVTFRMADGKEYAVVFTVESPKAQTKAVKELLKPEAASGTITLDIARLYGTQIDGGTLQIVKQRVPGASISGNALTLDLTLDNTVKIAYQYLDQKYQMSLTVKGR